MTLWIIRYPSVQRRKNDYIEKYLVERKLDLTATLDGEEAYRKADFIIIAALTYDPKENFFDCSAVEAVIETGIKITAERAGKDPIDTLFMGLTEAESVKLL